MADRAVKTRDENKIHGSVSKIRNNILAWAPQQHDCRNNWSSVSIILYHENTKVFHNFYFDHFPFAPRFSSFCLKSVVLLLIIIFYINAKWHDCNGLTEETVIHLHILFHIVRMNFVKWYGEGDGNGNGNGNVRQRWCWRQRSLFILAILFTSYHILISNGNSPSKNIQRICSVVIDLLKITSHWLKECMLMTTLGPGIFHEDRIYLLEWPQPNHV